MKKSVILRLVLIILAICGIVCSFLPLCLGIYDIGSMFIQGICVGIIFFAVFYDKIKGKVLSKIMTVALVCFSVLVLYSGFCLFQILKAEFTTYVPKDATVIVLGTQIKESGPSLTFKQRLDAGYDYIIENPNSVCIVTGGQGKNEPMPEGTGGAGYLLEKGLTKSQVIAESKSKDTLQNLQFSKDIIEQNGLNSDIIIVTQGFHQYRAGLQAKSLGFENVYSIVAKSHPFLLPSYYGREILAVTKQYLYNFMGLR